MILQSVGLRFGSVYKMDVYITVSSWDYLFYDSRPWKVVPTGIAAYLASPLITEDIVLFVIRVVPLSSALWCLQLSLLSSCFNLLAEFIPGRKPWKVTHLHNSLGCRQTSLEIWWGGGNQSLPPWFSSLSCHLTWGNWSFSPHFPQATSIWSTFFWFLPQVTVCLACSTAHQPSILRQRTERIERRYMTVSRLQLLPNHPFLCALDSL